MKQSELNKLLNQIGKDSAKKHNWKFSRGFLFKATDQLFFSLIIVGHAKSRNLHHLFQYKQLSFDELFWKIVQLEENTKQPLSFRAAGVWTAPMTTISTANQSVDGWDAEPLSLWMDEILIFCDSMVEKLSAEIQSIDDNLRAIERFDADQRMKYPDGAFDIWCERLLTAFLKEDYFLAQQIIEDRRKHRDSGRFMVGGKSFYDLADEYLQKIN